MNFKLLLQNKTLEKLTQPAPALHDAFGAGKYSRCHFVPAVEAEIREF